MQGHPFHHLPGGLRLIRLRFRLNDNICIRLVQKVVQSINVILIYTICAVFRHKGILLRITSICHGRTVHGKQAISVIQLLIVTGIIELMKKVFQSVWKQFVSLLYEGRIRDTDILRAEVVVQFLVQGIPARRKQNLYKVGKRYLAITDEVGFRIP